MFPEEVLLEERRINHLHLKNKRLLFNLRTNSSSTIPSLTAGSGRTHVLLPKPRAGRGPRG